MMRKSERIARAFRLEHASSAVPKKTMLNGIATELAGLT
jgi:hypothetical protein